MLTLGKKEYKTLHKVLLKSPNWSITAEFHLAEERNFTHYKITHVLKNLEERIEYYLTGNHRTSCCRLGNIRYTVRLDDEGSTYIDLLAKEFYWIRRHIHPIKDEESLAILREVPVVRAVSLQSNMELKDKRDWRVTEKGWVGRTDFGVPYEEDDFKDFLEKYENQFLQLAHKKEQEILKEIPNSFLLRKVLVITLDQQNSKLRLEADVYQFRKNFGATYRIIPAPFGGQYRKLKISKFINNG